MERGFGVYLPTAVEVTAGSWHVRSGAEPQFGQPLATDDAICRWWAAPAADLGLPLLAALAPAGVFRPACWSGADIRRVAEEAARLEAWWGAADLPYEVLSDLREAGRYLREAAAEAEACGGWLVIE